MPKTKKLEITDVYEPWCVATLADGTKLRARLNFTVATMEVDDEGKPIYDAVTGEPNYAIQFKWVVAQDVPDANKKPE